MMLLKIVAKCNTRVR